MMHEELLLKALFDYDQCKQLLLFTYRETFVREITA